MEMTAVFIIVALLINGLGGLVGGLISPSFLHRYLGIFLPLAAGLLLGTAFLDLIPHSLATLNSQLLALQESAGHHHHDLEDLLFRQNTLVFIAVLSGFVGFYLLEHFLGSHAAGQQGHRHHDHAGPLLLLGDALHNISDGVAISSAFLLDYRIGLATTLTVILHELPQEIADYTILISQGWSRLRAMVALGIVQLSAFMGAAGVYFFAQFIETAIPYVLSFSAGGFIYIASADLLPEIQRRRGEKQSFLRVLALFLGAAIIYLLHIFLGHSHS